MMARWFQSDLSIGDRCEILEGDAFANRVVARAETPELAAAMVAEHNTATRFEAIAAVLPLHAQRIAEATFEDGGSERLEFLLSEPLEAHENARSVLLGSFCFMPSSEGHDYWMALADGPDR